MEVKQELAAVPANEGIPNRPRIVRFNMKYACLFLQWLNFNNRFYDFLLMHSFGNISD